MPARSKAQATAARIAIHHPEKLYARNKGLLGMSMKDIHHLAATRTADLPMHAKKGKKR